MGIHWNGEVTLGNILVICVWLIGAVAFYYNTNWRIKILERWKDNQEVIAAADVKSFSTLVEAVAALKEIAKGQHRRLEMLEDR